MARIRIDKAVRATLLDELIAGGVGPLTPEGTSILHLDPDGRGGYLAVPDDREALARQIIAAHDAGAYDSAREARRLEDATDNDLARQMYAVILADAARLEDSTQAMTAQVIRNHLARTDKVLAAVLRRLNRTGVLNDPDPVVPPGP